MTGDWLHEVVKASAREKYISGLTGIRGRLIQTWDAIQGWTAVALIGFFTAVVAFLVDIAQATMFDWKLGTPLPSSRANCRILQREMVASAIKLLSRFNLSHLHCRTHLSHLAPMVVRPLQHPHLIPRKRIPTIRSHRPCLGSHLRLPHPPNLSFPSHTRLERIRPYSSPTKGTIHGRWFRNPRNQNHPFRIRHPRFSLCPCASRKSHRRSLRHRKWNVSRQRGAIRACQCLCR